MVTKEDLQTFLDRLEGGSVEVREVEPGLWLVRSQHGSEVVVTYSPSPSWARSRPPRRRS